MKGKKVLIIGGGPGGYTAALEAAKRGLQVTLVEEEHVGGTCLNVGCIPTKALLEASTLYRRLQTRAVDLGISCEGVSFDWPAMQRRKHDVVETLVLGVESMLRRAGVEVIRGRARFTSERTVDIRLPTGDTVERRFERAVIATGARPVRLNLPGMDTPGVLDSTGALALDDLPERMVIVGGGVIGTEFASLFADLGVRVTLIEMQFRLLPTLPAETVGVLTESLRERGVRLHLEAAVDGFEALPNGVRTRLGGGETVDADRVLFAIGRRPNTGDLGLERIGMVPGQAIDVDASLETAVSGIYAIGDCTGGIQLAHRAAAEGIMVASVLAGEPVRWHERQVPACVYTSPEIATVGLDLDVAKAQGIPIRMETHAFSINGKALISGETEGHVTLIAHATTGRLLGAQMVGPHVTELIDEIVLALRLEATEEELRTTIHAHPTLSEILWETVRAF